MTPVTILEYLDHLGRETGVRCQTGAYVLDNEARDAFLPRLWAAISALKSEQIVPAEVIAIQLENDRLAELQRQLDEKAKADAAEAEKKQAAFDAQIKPLQAAVIVQENSAPPVVHVYQDGGGGRGGGGCTLQ